jgi:hypothetical protein
VLLAVRLEETLLELYPRLVLCWVNNILDVFILNFLFESLLLGGAAILDDVVDLSLEISEGHAESSVLPCHHFEVPVKDRDLVNGWGNAGVSAVSGGNAP